MSGVGLTASATEPLTLRFQRSGSDVNISASIEGISASLTSFSHTLKNVDNTILCADVNGSTSPTIVYQFSISGFPEEWTFNNVGLDIHALNNNGGDQNPSDGKNRQFNVSVTTGEMPLVNYTNLDPAAGIAGGRKVWNKKISEPISPDDPLTLTITVTKGDENVGCFFGLQGITLSTDDTEPLPVHTPYALSHQLYKLPCGSIGDTWFSEVTIGNEFHYPMATITNPAPKVTSKPSKYVIQSRDAAIVFPGMETNISVSLNKVPADNNRIFLYADWNRDGEFEHSQELANLQTQEINISVPSDALVGRSRLRLRLTNNSLTGADDDIYGEVIDILVNIVEPSSTLIVPELRVNDKARGTVLWSDDTATASPLGNSLFLYWGEGLRIHSTEAICAAPAGNTPRVFTAYFSANTQILDGIDPVILNRTDSGLEIRNNDNMIEAPGTNIILIFAIDGNCAKSVCADILDATGLPSGIYIIKAISNIGTATKKIIL